MFFEQIKAGNRLEISLAGVENGKTYLSQVEEIADQKLLVVHMPISYGKLIRLDSKVKYCILIYTDNGMLLYDAVIQDFFKTDGMEMMSLRLTSDGEKTQKRMFFRYDCLLPVNFSVIKDMTESGGKKEVDSVVHNGITKNISGGGIRFVSESAVEEGSHIKCVVVLKDSLIVAIGKIIERLHFPKATYKYQYRVMFVGILPETQEKIIKFIFSEQRKSLKKLSI